MSETLDDMSDLVKQYVQDGASLCSLAEKYGTYSYDIKFLLSIHGVTEFRTNHEQMALHRVKRERERKVVYVQAYKGYVIGIHDTLTEASEAVGVSVSRISKCVKGQAWSAGGYNWRRVDA